MQVNYLHGTLKNGAEEGIPKKPNKNK